MRNKPLLQMGLIGAIGIAIGIPVALSIPWFPAEGSTQAQHIHTLYDVLLIVTVPIFVLVMTIILYSAWNSSCVSWKRLSAASAISRSSVWMWFIQFIGSVSHSSGVKPKIELICGLT